ncbi:MAG: energy transducer TonB [bacterium]|nr:energy transducer TonB [bacterium]
MGGIHGLTGLQESFFVPREARLEFTLRSVETRDRTAQATAPRPSPDGVAQKSPQNAAAIPDDSAATEGEEFVPVGRTGRGPRWIAGHITRDDYPAAAEREGLESIVRALVFIRRDGSVHRVRILKGHTAFHATVLRKLKQARFSPALDRESGRPIAVKLILPIEFRLR